MSETFNMRAAIAKLRPEHLVAYLVSQDWEAAHCRYEDRLMFLGEEHDEGRYELILPSSREVQNAKTLLQRAIYKLCGIEDRDPREILHDVFLEFERSGTEVVPPPSGRLFRFRNQSPHVLRLRITSRPTELELLPQEAVEVALRTPEGTVAEVEYRGHLIIIHDG